ncbi:MAG: thiamine phosphate synthase [Deltaproteobacteria bacterium]|jgi:thiamine-phosphate pyrophosphorylase|nr:thiamine phosphate synthase [Deltaproteobacteria bacterium]
MWDKKSLAEKLTLTLVISQKEAAPRTIEELAELAFEGGVTALQLREKNIRDRDLFDLAVRTAKFCRSRGKLFIVNDRLDIALACDADGLHLGQTDLPIEAAGKLWPRGKILGVSTSTKEEALFALKNGADYLGVGAIFATDSKRDASTIQESRIRDLNSLGAVTVAIGGISVDNAAEVWKLGFDSIAVISALAQAANPVETARKLLVGSPK